MTESPAPADDVPLMRNPEAADSRVGDETVILHLGSGTYFGLDPVGTRIWELLETPRACADLRALLVREFDVAPEVLARDVRTFIDALLAHGIVIPA